MIFLLIMGLIFLLHFMPRNFSLDAEYVNKYFCVCLGMKLNYLKTWKFHTFGSSFSDLLGWPRAMLSPGLINYSSLLEQVVVYSTYCPMNLEFSSLVCGTGTIPGPADKYCFL